MLALLTTIHVLVAFILILIVLLQSARGTDLAGAFGGMGSQTAFGPRGTATFLSKATVVLAGIFMLSSLALAILSNRSLAGGGDSLLSGQETAAPEAETTPAPASPGQAPGVGVQTEGLPPGVRVTVVPPGESSGAAAGNPPAAPSESAPPPAPAQTSQPAPPAATGSSP